jgi:hypothetical protein
MISNFIRRIFGGSPPDPDPGSPDEEAYVYPNELDSNMKAAIVSIWQQYARSGNQIQIGIQGMGETLEHYHHRNAVLKNGLLFWENESDSDPIKIDSLQEFEDKFVAWIEQKMSRFSDTGEFAFGVTYLK